MLEAMKDDERTQTAAELVASTARNLESMTKSVKELTKTIKEKNELKDTYLGEIGKAEKGAVEFTYAGFCVLGLAGVLFVLLA